MFALLYANIKKIQRYISISISIPHTMCSTVMDALSLLNAQQTSCSEDNDCWYLLQNMMMARGGKREIRLEFHFTKHTIDFMSTIPDCQYF